MHTEEIENLLSEKFQEEGFQDCYLVSQEQNKKTIRLFIDSDSGMTFEKCQKISRYLEATFDQKGWFGNDYILEVSSAGIDRPLRFPRQYVKNKGREVQLRLLDGTKIIGSIVDANDQGVTLSREDIRKEGKKKIRETIETQLAYNSIQEARIVIKI